MDATSVLAELLRDPLVVVDVGCRWGFADSWARLGDRVVVIGFDPDRAECDRLRQLYSGHPGVRLVPLALGEKAGRETLYLTEDPGGYSLYPPDPDVVTRHPALAGGRLVGTDEVEVTTLDEWLVHSGIRGVDVIKLDTQGSELGVLTGAEGVLPTVRAVELEVEFNPLYEGVPLFAAIDEFLRRRGFVLWRLKDLAHYAQQGASHHWRALEAQYYDDYVARLESGSGQLFWANAFYLRRSVAYPDEAAGWEVLVRDACVTGALGFHDLAGLALERARASAPRHLVDALAAALSEDLVVAWRERSLRDRSTLLTGSVTLHVGDAAFQGSGWRSLQRVDGGSVRWTGPAREASIDLPYQLPPATRIELSVPAAMSAAILEQLSLEVNRVPVPLASTAGEHGLLYSATLPATFRSSRRFTRLVLRTVETVPWNESDTESSDDTELGLALSWVRLTAPAQ